MELPIIPVVVVVALLNLIAFFVMGWDKRRSVKGERRVSERALCLWGVPFAVLGMLLGMLYFRHKTKKRSFQAKAALVVFLNVGLGVLVGYAMTEGWIRFS